MAKVMKKALAAALTVSLAGTMLTTGAMTASAETSTGVGLAAHALRAYREGWQYVWGGTSEGTVDCSGLIYTYNCAGGNRVEMLASSSEYGYISEGIPRIHGLGLHMPGHVGVYIGGGMAVDARDEYSGVVYHNVYNKSWVEWFKVAGVNYPQNGWVLLDGDSFYYENGQYVVNTTRTIDGITYSFGGDGASDFAPPASAYLATDYSTASASQGVATSYEEESDADEYYEEESEDTQEEESSEEEESVEEYVEESYEEPEESEQSEEVYEESVDTEESTEEASEEVSEASEASEESEESEESDVEFIFSANEQPTEVLGESSEVAYLVEESSQVQTEEVSAEESSEEAVEASETTPVQEEQKPASKVVAEYGDQDYGDSKFVERAQKKLYELGYSSSKPTGYFYEDMIYAVYHFQEMNGLQATGRVDEDTLKKLESGDAVSAFVDLYYGSGDEAIYGEVSALQTRLKELGYFEGEVNGYFGDSTKAAVEQFQGDNDLKKTGDADIATQKKLFKLDAAKKKAEPKAEPAAAPKQEQTIINNTTNNTTNNTDNSKSDNSSSNVTNNYYYYNYYYTQPETENKEPVVTYSAKSDATAKMIERLAQLRYLASAKGNAFDDEVLTAVHLFQRTAGFEEADTMTDEMLEALYAKSAPKSPEYNNLKVGYTGDDVSSLQEKLAKLKYYEGKTTGTYTAALEEAVKRFQKDNGLEETGVADIKTLETLETVSLREESKADNKTASEKYILKTATVADDALSNIAKGSVKAPTASEQKTKANVSNEMPDGTQDTLPFIGLAGAFLALSSALIAVIIAKKRKRANLLNSFED